jgi:AcrR family transcriptional regulator
MESREKTDPAARILRGARSHFFSQGFRRVTMDDLAAELGMSKKTLYANFPSKAALLEAVLADKFARVGGELEAITARGDFQFPERLHALLSCVRSHVDEIQPPFMRDLAREAPELFDRIRANRRALIHRHFAHVLREGREAGMIRGDVPVPVMIEFLIGAADAVVNPAKLEELGLTAREAFAKVISLFLQGAMAEPGSLKL